jgi:hypothetical protein
MVTHGIDIPKLDRVVLFPTLYLHLADKGYSFSVLFIPWFAINQPNCADVVMLHTTLRKGLVGEQVNVLSLHFLIADFDRWFVDLVLKLVNEAEKSGVFVVWVGVLREAKTAFLVREHEPENCRELLWLELFMNARDILPNDGKNGVLVHQWVRCHCNIGDWNRLVRHKKNPKLPGLPRALYIPSNVLTTNLVDLKLKLLRNDLLDISKGAVLKQKAGLLAIQGEYSNRRHLAGA